MSSHDAELSAGFPWLLFAPDGCVPAPLYMRPTSEAKYRTRRVWVGDGAILRHVLMAATLASVSNGWKAADSSARSDGNRRTEAVKIRRAENRMIPLDGWTLT